MKSIIFTIGVFFLLNTPKEYQKNFYKNGMLKEEGWIKNKLKIKYWYFYYDDGTIKNEGHFVNGKKNKWWIFYNKAGEVIHKCQLKNNKKNGYCLKYKNEKIKSAQKYEKGKKVNEWYDLSSFKLENSLNDLR